MNSQNWYYWLTYVIYFLKKRYMIREVDFNGRKWNNMGQGYFVEMWDFLFFAFLLPCCPVLISLFFDHPASLSCLCVLVGIPFAKNMRNGMAPQICTCEMRHGMSLFSFRNSGKNWWFFHNAFWIQLSLWPRCQELICLEDW